MVWLRCWCRVPPTATGPPAPRVHCVVGRRARRWRPATLRTEPHRRPRLRDRLCARVRIRRQQVTHDRHDPPRYGDGGHRPHLRGGHHHLELLRLPVPQLQVPDRQRGSLLRDHLLRILGLRRRARPLLLGVELRCADPTRESTRGPPRLGSSQPRHVPHAPRHQYECPVRPQQRERWKHVDATCAGWSSQSWEQWDTDPTGTASCLNATHRCEPVDADKIGKRAGTCTPGGGEVECWEYTPTRSSSASAPSSRSSVSCARIATSAALKRRDHPLRRLVVPRWQLHGHEQHPLPPSPHSLPNLCLRMRCPRITAYVVIKLSAVKYCALFS